MAISAAGRKTVPGRASTTRCGTVLQGGGRKAGRKEQPTTACLDSQSVKTTALAGGKGFDAGKKIQRRKRHFLVDTLGLVLVVVVTAASVQDRDGAKRVFQALSDSCKQVRLVWVDGGHRGGLPDWVLERFKFVLEVVLRSDTAKGFGLLPKRRVVMYTSRGHACGFPK